MKAFKLGLILVLTLAFSSSGQEARFFRLMGPVPTAITSFTADGYMTWTNELTNATFTVQTATSLVGASNWVDYVQIPVTNGVNTNRLIDLNPPAGMALIPAGEFTMGNAMSPSEGYSDELPLHTVYVSAFYMDKYEVTKAQWDSVYRWATNHGYSFDFRGSGKALDHPVQTVDWYDIVKCCNARSEMEGLVPAYYTSAAQTTVYRTGQVDVQDTWVKWTAGYRLPTEAEWEKAARGGASGQRFPWGNTISGTNANYYGYPSFYSYDLGPDGYNPAFKTGGVYTSPVGYFSTNGYGLYDMAGNVWEWCWDWYGGYSNGSQSDPLGPTSGSYRVLGGGSWEDFAYFCRVAHRYGSYPTNAGNRIGFRSVLAPGQ